MTITTVLSDNAQRIFDDIESQFQLDNDSLVELTKEFLTETQDGLQNYGRAMALIPTFVTGIPDGSETGTYLALDLGGTNLRVCEVTLNGDKTFSLRQKKYKVSDTLKTGEASALFDYLADSVDSFLTSQSKDIVESNSDVVHLGLTFSFPVEQTALDSGKLTTWTKGFSAKNAVGNDVVKLLQDAFDRKHMHVKCIAMVNDTVGTLLTRAYTSGSCLLGGIFGTGTNGAYVEQVKNITKLGNSPAAGKGGEMVVNMEWGAFNNSRSHLPTTAFDNALDRLSINVNSQAFEKFISGMYLGEITRYILTSLIDAAVPGVGGRGKRGPLLLGGKSGDILNKQWGLDSSVMSEIEEAWEGPLASQGAKKEEPEECPKFTELDEDKLSNGLKTKLNRIKNVIVKSLGYKEAEVTLRDAAIVRWACMIVARRAGLLSGMAVAAVLIKTGNAALPGNTPPAGASKELHVGLDGSLVEHYPNFERTLRESLRALVGEAVEKRVDIGLAKDGSGVGAALGALSALKQMGDKPK